MNTDLKNKIREGQGTNWVNLLAIFCGIIFGSAFVFGPIFSGIDAINQKIVQAYHCTGAIGITEKRGPIVQVGSDPNSFGQSVEGICTFPDGSTKVVSNDDYAVTSIIGSLCLGAIFGVGIAVIFTPIYISWKEKAT